jgi:hypothetical protein
VALSHEQEASLQMDVYWKRYIRYIKHPETLGEIRWNKKIIETYAWRLVLEKKMSEEDYNAFLAHERANRYSEEQSADSSNHQPTYN